MSSLASNGVEQKQQQQQQQEHEHRSESWLPRLAAGLGKEHVRTLPPKVAPSGGAVFVQMVAAARETAVSAQQALRRPFQ